MSYNINNNQIILTCKSVKFYLPYDEDAFFGWIAKIKSIIKFDGIRDELYLYFETNELPNTDVRELLGLFDRYKIDMKQLKIFINETNKEWQKWKNFNVA